MANKIKSKWDSLDKNIQKWATRLGAIATIIGIVAAGGSWLINNINDDLASKIESQTTQLQDEVQKLSDKVEEKNKQTDLQLTRLELMTLMETNPKNVIEIERLARYYFVDLKGDFYMTSVYSIWAEQYGGDTSFVAYHD